MPHSNVEQINVFISSAQRSENGFAWADIRREIKDNLSQCPYIKAFIIEDSTSEIKSTQFFSYKVERSDIVVLLVKGEVRSGTLAEYALAKKLNKPFLIYFIKDEQPDINVARLKQEIENNDCCTYCGTLESSEHIGEKILSDLINNIIDYYKFNHRTTINRDETLEIQASSSLLASGQIIPNKTALSFFKSSYNQLYDRIGCGYLKNDKQTELSALHNLGTKIIDWLVLGTPFYDDADLSKLIEQLKDLYPDTQWLSLRFAAINKYFNAELEDALKLEEQALALAKSSKLPEWVINDILIDCRNFEHAIKAKNRDYTLGEYQKELNKLTSFIYLPVSDRFLEEAYGESIKEEIELKTKSPETITLGTNITQVLNHVENYLFSSILYGSCIHLIISRQALARILYKYGELACDNHMLFMALSLHLLNGDSKMFKQILLNKWDSIYSVTTANISQLWELTNHIIPTSRDEIKQLFLAHLGMYLSNKEFAEAESYLLNSAQQVTWECSSSYFNCVKNLLYRLNQETILEKIVKIIKEKRFNLGSDITDVLFGLNIKNISSQLLENLCNALQTAMKQIISRNGDPQAIAFLIREAPAIFLPLKDNPDNGISGIQEMYYELNSGTGSWEKILCTAITNVIAQYDANKKRGSYVGFAMRPFAIIANIMDNYFMSGFENIIIEQLLPTCIKILLSATNIPLKDDCLGALCSIVSRFIKEDVAIPTELVDATAQCDISKDGDVPLFNQSTRETLHLRLTILKVLLKIEQHDALFGLCLAYPKRDINAREVLSECILSLLNKSKEISDCLDATTLSLVFQFADDEYFNIRITGIKCLILISNSKYGDMARRRLCEFTLDASPAVRIQLLRLCHQQTILDRDVSKTIIDTLSKDANYRIRKEATRLIACK